MKWQEIIRNWEKEQRALIYELRTFKTNEYKRGYADGLETAIDTLLAYLEELEEGNDPGN